MNIAKIKTEIENLRIDWVGESPSSPTVFTCDGRIAVSAEDGKVLADYYGEFLGGYPWIHPELEAFAEERGLYWEWRDAGSIELLAR